MTTPRIKVETVTLHDGRKMDVIRDVEAVKHILTAIHASVLRWREKAAAFERRSHSVEGPMDDILLSKAATLRTCALDVEDIALQDANQ